MKLATTTSDFGLYGLTQQETLQKISDAGFRYVDYSFGIDWKRGNGFYTDAWQKHGDSMLAAAEKAGVKFVQAHSPMGAPITKNEQQRPFIEGTKRAIEGAAYLGIPNIVVHAGHCRGVLKEENFVLNKQFFDEILETADKVNINVLVENFNSMFDDNWYWIDNAAETLELCNYINNPRLKIVWDTGHGNLPEHTGRNLGQREALNLLGDKVYALHVQDNYGDDHHVFPGFGTMNLDSLMYGLKDIGYNGYFTFEATNLPSSPSGKAKFPEDSRCAFLPIEFRERLEKMLYDIGKFILTQYGVFEE